MNLHFVISYRAPFGQSMHILVTYEDDQGRLRDSDILMHTDDGSQWEAETTGPTLREVNVRRLSYMYQLEDDEGKAIRQEWSAVPRLYAIDPTKTYNFLDIWRDLPLQRYIYPLRTDITPTPIGAIPVFGKSVIFRVSAPQVEKGQSLAVLGSEPVLGQWKETRFLPMSYIGDGDWMLSINAVALQLPFEYKYVIVDDAKGEMVEWESGDNRLVKLHRRMRDGDQVVDYGGQLRCQCPLRFHSELSGEDSNYLRHEIRELYI